MPKVLDENGVARLWAKIKDRLGASTAEDVLYDNIASGIDAETVQAAIDVLTVLINEKAASTHKHAAADITSGILALARGGTGLSASPSMLVNLGTTTAANVMQASPRPGVTGVLPVINGGTGGATVAAAQANLGVRRGNVTIMASAANTPTSKAVTWAALSSVPTITATAASKVAGTTLKGVAFTSPATTGCSLWTTRSDTSGSTVHYIAIG